MQMFIIISFSYSIGTEIQASPLKLKNLQIQFNSKNCWVKKETNFTKQETLKKK